MSEQPQAERPVVARLYLPLVKSGRAQVVYGLSGAKYSFRCLPNGRPTRDYHSLADFEREELDMRRNTRNPFAVCTQLGEQDPALRATEFLEELIKARLRVPLARRRETLLALQARITQALSELEVDAAPEPEPEPQPAPQQPAEPAPAEPAEPVAAFNEEQLMDMKWEELRALAKEHGVAPSSRAETVAALLKL